MCNCNGGSCDRILSPIDRLHLRIERLERFIDGSSMQCAEMSQRIEKMEKALSEEMARTREMDDILANIVQAMATSSVHRPDFSGTPTNAETQEQVGKDMARATHGSGWHIDMDGSKRPMSGIAHLAGEGQFRSVPYDIAIDPKASPSGIPFSVALECLKAGRKVALKGWVFAWIQAHPVYGISFHRGYDDVVQCFAVTEGALTAMMGSDWMVLPEKPQNP